MGNLDFENEILKNSSELKDLFEYIVTYKDCFMDLNKKLEHDFEKLFYPIMLQDKTLLFNNRYLECFTVIVKALGYYEKAYEFPELMELIQIRRGYLLNMHTYMNQSYDCHNFSLYLLAYAYYHSLSEEELDSLLKDLFTHYEEILEWGYMNGLTSFMTTILRTEYNSLKKDYYPYITDYLISRLNNKEVK